MNNQAHIIEWGLKLLLSKGCVLEHSPEMMIETPWSTVIRFSTSKGCFYLKKTPVDLFIEAEIIKAIQINMPNSLVPIIIFQNHDLNCFLMNSCGDYSLRTKFNGSIEPNLLINGLNAYLNILRSFEQNLDVLKGISVPDWRIYRIPDLYVELLQKKDMLLDEGLTCDALEKLIRFVPTLKSICECLSEQKVKETLVNSSTIPSFLSIAKSISKNFNF